MIGWTVSSFQLSSLDSLQLQKLKSFPKDVVGNRIVVLYAGLCLARRGEDDDTSLLIDLADPTALFPGLYGGRIESGVIERLNRIDMTVGGHAGREVRQVIREQLCAFDIGDQ